MSTTETLVKLNLGCGQNHIPGYINVDKFGNPDVVCDLEVFPWPWDDNSVDEVVLTHVLEHLGETKEVYLNIIKELYRVCKHGAVITITVPHPRHDDFMNDPTHVRAITPDSLALFSKKKNREWAEVGAANSPLALYLDVDFDLGKINFTPAEPWASKLASGELRDVDVWEASRKYNNVFKQVTIQLHVVKESD